MIYRVLVIATMTRTLAVFRLITPLCILIAYSEAWKPLQSWNPSGPVLNTFSRSTSKPVYLSTKSYLSLVPNLDINPSPDEQFIPEPFEINEKTSVILHKVHSITDKDDGEADEEDGEADEESTDEDMSTFIEYSENSEEDLNVEDDSQEPDRAQNSEEILEESNIEHDSGELDSEEYLNLLNSNEIHEEDWQGEENSTYLDSDEDQDFKYDD